ncbi:MAG: universal stress protein [Burkholderiaceae bacterium]|jgi:nucleotide-binding universal stress UspA family protein|nr:universal stress protein [Burkholderiaceae bacterium]
MFKKIMIPTDGSEISLSAALDGIAFAADNRAEAVGIYVAPEYQYPVYIEIIPATYPLEEEYQGLMRKIGTEYLKPIRDAAEKADVSYTSHFVFSDSPAGAIAQAAEALGCDLIFMGSHGRTGLGQFILGSVTTKVLSLCKIPVLVDRPKRKSST